MHTGRNNGAVTTVVFCCICQSCAGIIKFQRIQLGSRGACFSWFHVASCNWRLLFLSVTSMFSWQTLFVLVAGRPLCTADTYFHAVLGKHFAGWKLLHGWGRRFSVLICPAGWVGPGLGKTHLLLQPTAAPEQGKDRQGLSLYLSPRISFCYV